MANNDVDYFLKGAELGQKGNYYNALSQSRMENAKTRQLEIARKYMESEQKKDEVEYKRAKEAADFVSARVDGMDVAQKQIFLESDQMKPVLQMIKKNLPYHFDNGEFIPRRTNDMIKEKMDGLRYDLMSKKAKGQLNPQEEQALNLIENKDLDMLAESMRMVSRNDELKNADPAEQFQAAVRIYELAEQYRAKKNQNNPATASLAQPVEQPAPAQTETPSFLPKDQFGFFQGQEVEKNGKKWTYKGNNKWGESING